MFLGHSFVIGVLFSATGVHLKPSPIRYFNASAQAITLYPDGVRKEVLTYNGLLPGPILVLDKGVRIIMTLDNFLQSGEPTTIHWHGIHQHNDQFEDGPVMIAQCPLPYGHTQYYNFTIEQIGTHWYHSHYSGQYTDGLFGAFIVQNGLNGAIDKQDYGYFSDLVVMLSDHYHADYRTNQRIYMNTAIPPKPQSALINGHGVYHCRPELPFAPLSFGAIYEGANCRQDMLVRSTYHVFPKRTYRIRVINASSISAFTFSIDYHTLWTMEVDGVLVHPDKVTEATHAVIAAGQVYSFLVDMDQPVGKYSIRAVMKNDIFSVLDDTPLQLSVTAEELLSHTVTAALIYHTNLELTDAERHYFPRITEKITLFQSYTNSFGPVYSKQMFVDEMTLLPADGEEAPEDVDVEFKLNFKVTITEDGHILSLVNGQRYVAPIDKPLIFYYMQGQKIPEESNPIEIHYNETVQLIIYNKEPFAHPMHLHGHDFWVLGKGKPFSGEYNPEIHFEQLQTATVKRNVVQVPPKTWVVLRFVADNPGVWPFHCHIDWHYLGGMVVVFVSGQKHFKDNKGSKNNITREARRLCILNDICVDSCDLPKL